MKAKPLAAGEFVTKVYRYGIPSWYALDDTTRNQLRLANMLRNDIVAIERDHQEAREAAESAIPELADIRAEIDRLEALREDVYAALKAERVTDQSTVARGSTSDELADVKASLKAARDRYKKARTRLKAGLKPSYDEAAGAKKAALKNLYGKYCQEGVELSQRGEVIPQQDPVTGCTLGWATFNDVAAHMKTALDSLIKKRMQGMPADFRFRRFDDTGSLSVQVMWQSGKQVATPDLLASDEGPYKNVVQLTPWSDPETIDRPRGMEQRHGKLQLRVVSGHTICVPVVLHRMMPAAAEIKEVKLVARKVGHATRLSVSFVVRVPRPADNSDPNGTGVYLTQNWRSNGDGSIQVGELVSNRDLPPVSHELENLVVPMDSGGYAIFLDAPLGPGHKQGRDRHIGWALSKADDIRSIRDKELDALKPQVVEAVRDRDLAEHLSGHGIDVTYIPQWRSATRFARLAQIWPREHKLYPELERWRKHDHEHLWNYEAHSRDQAVARRTDRYRKLAAWIADAADVIVIDKVEVAKLRQTAALGQEDDYQARGGRKNIQASAPAEFAAAVKAAAVARGKKVTDNSRTDGGDD